VVEACRLRMVKGALASSVEQSVWPAGLGIKGHRSYIHCITE
jgi:hypothetical protein